MTQRLLAITSACAALSLGGCASLNGSDSSDLLKQLDSNFAACDRHLAFSGAVGVLTPGAQVSGSVDCKGGVSDPSSAAAPKAES